MENTSHVSKESWLSLSTANVICLTNCTFCWTLAIHHLSQIPKPALPDLQGERTRNCPEHYWPLFNEAVGSSVIVWINNYRWTNNLKHLPFYYTADGLQDQPFNFSTKVSNTTSSTVEAHQFLMSCNFFMLSICLKSHLPPKHWTLPFACILYSFLWCGFPVKVKLHVQAVSAGAYFMKSVHKPPHKLLI